MSASSVCTSYIRGTPPHGVVRLKIMKYKVDSMNCMEVTAWTKYDPCDPCDLNLGSRSLNCTRTHARLWCWSFVRDIKLTIGLCLHQYLAIWMPFWNILHYQHMKTSGYQLSIFLDQNMYELGIKTTMFNLSIKIWNSGHLGRHLQFLQMPYDTIWVSFGF